MKAEENDDDIWESAKSETNAEKTYREKSVKLKANSLKWSIKLTNHTSDRPRKQE